LTGRDKEQSKRQVGHLSESEALDWVSKRRRLERSICFIYMRFWLRRWMGTKIGIAGLLYRLVELRELKRKESKREG
jgi:hypothetical protein